MASTLRTALRELPLASTTALAACRSSSWNSSCSIWRSTFSLFLPNSIWFSFATSSTSRSISAGTRAQRAHVVLMLGNHECLHRFKIELLKVRKRSSKHVRSMP